MMALSRVRWDRSVCGGRSDDDLFDNDATAEPTVGDPKNVY